MSEIFSEPEPVPRTCLGLALHGDDIGVPIDVIVVVKHLQDGEIYHNILSSEHLSSVEALGMVRFANVRIERVLSMPDDREPEEDTE